MATAAFDAVFLAAVIAHEPFLAHTFLVSNLTDTFTVARALVRARHQVACSATPSGTAVALVLAVFLEANAIA